MIQRWSQYFAACVTALVLAAPASAAVITFDNLAGANEAPFTSPYVEGGYTVTPGAGWLTGQIYGNAIPSIFSGPYYGMAGPREITVTGGTFTFDAIDLSSNVGAGTTYNFVGSLLGSTVFDLSGTLGSTGFTTILSSSAAVIDSLTIIMTPAVGVTSYNIDNIVVNAASVAVPAPVTLSLLGLGLVGLAAARRKRAA